MNHLIKALLKAIMVPFYRSHAGLLLFVFYVMFGMVEAGQLISYHRALIEGMLGSLFFLACVLVLWALYNFKILLFTLNLLREPEYQFVQHVGQLPQYKIFGLFFLINCVAFSPVLCYSIFIYQIGLTQSYYTSSIYILLYQVLLCSFNAWIILTYLKTQHLFTWRMFQLRLPSVGGKIGFYVSYFLNDEKIALFLSKVFSLVLLYFVKENTSPGDDFRIVGLAWLFAISSHTFLILKIRAFEDRYLSWVRALPITISRTYLLSFVFYTFLLWPEILLITAEIGETLTVLDYITLIAFTGGFMMFIHAYLLKPDRNADQFSLFLFWLFIVSFFIILCKLITLLTIILCASSYLIIFKRYFEYEPVVQD